MIIPPIIHEAADWIAGPPDAKRWRIVTGMLGWGCVLALAGMLLTAGLGFSKVAGWLGPIALFLFPIADRLLRKSSRHHDY